MRDLFIVLFVTFVTGFMAGWFTAGFLKDNETPVAPNVDDSSLD